MNCQKSNTLGQVCYSRSRTSCDFQPTPSSTMLWRLSFPCFYYFIIIFIFFFILGLFIDTTRSSGNELVNPSLANLHFCPVTTCRSLGSLHCSPQPLSASQWHHSPFTHFSAAAARGNQRSRRDAFRDPIKTRTSDFPLTYVWETLLFIACVDRKWKEF